MKLIEEKLTSNNDLDNLRTAILRELVEEVNWLAADRGNSAGFSEAHMTATWGS